ncbi:Multidrug resistance protein 1, partial [Apophysomyces sp. BC1021]
MLSSFTLYIQAIVFFAASHFIQDGLMKFSELLPSLLVIILSAASVGRISTFLPDYGQASLSASSIFEILERRPTIDPELEGIEPCSVQGEIAFDN